MDISKPKGLKVIEAVLSTRKFTQYQISVVGPLPFETSV